jgi:hypothetical protein
MSDINCPYCDTKQSVSRDDGHGCEEGVLYEQECRSCEKAFVFTTGIRFYHTPYRADCLNGAEHDLKFAPAIPAQFSKMRCRGCGFERRPTDAEFEANGFDLNEVKIDEG